MAKVHETWTVLEHGPLEQLSDNLWRLEGSLPGMALRRVMTVARLEDGELLIHNGICLEDQQLQELEALGEPAVLVVPNGWHRLDAVAFKGRFPGVRVLCPAGSRKLVEKVIEADGDYDDFSGDETVTLDHLDGMKNKEGVLCVHSEDGATLVFNDAVFNQPHQKGVAGLVFRLLGSTGGPTVSRVFKLMAISDRAAFQAHLQRLAETPDLRRIIVSHHRTIDEDAAGVLRGVAAKL